MTIVKYPKNGEECEKCGSKEIEQVGEDTWSDLTEEGKQDRKIWFKCQKCGNVQYVREIRRVEG